MTSVGLRRISALLVVLAIALAGLEWCLLAHHHAEVGGRTVAASDCPAGESLHRAERVARQPTVAAMTVEAAEPRAVAAVEPGMATDDGTVRGDPPRPRPGPARLIELCVCRT